MNHRKILAALTAALLLIGTATAINQEYRQEYDWSNAADHSGVTWDGIQDHPDNKLVQGYKYGSITEGLVGYWSFEDKKGKVVDQALDNDGVFKGVNNGDLKNFDFNSESGWVEGRNNEGHALRFDGEDDYVDIPDSIGVFNGNTAFTISTWVNPEDVSTDYRRVVDFSGEAEIVLEISSNDGKIEFGVAEQGSGSKDFARADIETNKWQHFTAVYKPGNSISIYESGSQAQSNTISYSDINDRSMSSSIGAHREGNNVWKGTIGEIKIYNSSLSSSQITSLSENKGINRSNLVAEYGFDQGSGDKAYDTSRWRDGKLGDWSGELDGEDDLIELEDKSVRSVTVGSWVKWGGDSENTILVSGGGGSPSGEEFRLRVNSDGTVHFGVYDGSNTHGATTTENISTDEWTYLTGSYSAVSNTYTVSIDGQISASSQSTTGPADVDNPTRWSIGSWYNPGGDSYNNHFNGSIDSVRIYDRDLSSKEVQKLYNQNSEQKISPQDTLRSGLVGWWPLHETNSSTAQDLSGYNNDGTLNGGVTQGVAGKGGLTAYSFDGEDDTVSVGDRLDLQNKFTLSGWVKTSYEDDSYKNQSGMIDKRKSSSDYSGYVLNLKESGEAQVMIRDTEGNQSQAISRESYNDGKWHHILATVEKDSQRGLSLFVDGDEVRYSTRDDTKEIDSITNQADLQFGTLQQGGLGYLKGNLKGIRIYDRIISNPEILSLYQQGASDFATPPGQSDEGVAYWSFDNDDGDRVVEDEWNDHDGVLGTQDSSTHPSYKENGKIGEALSFDGSNDYVRVGDREKFNFGSSNFAASAWFKTSVEDNQQGNRQDIINKEYFGNTYEGLMVYICGGGGCGKAGYLATKIEDSDGDGIGSNDIEYVADGSWHHTVVMRKGDKGYVFLDGRLMEKTENSAVDSISHEDYLGIGGRVEDESNVFQGEIDDVRIYDQALSMPEAHELYQQGTGGRDMRQITRNQGLVGYWSLDEDSGQTAYDLSGHGNNGTLGSSDSSDSSDPTQGVDGVLGTSAYEFDGEDEYITANSSSLNTKESMAISLWAKPTELSANEEYELVTRWTPNGLDYIFGVRTDSDGDPYLTTFFDGGNDGESEKNVLPTDKWSHISITYYSRGNTQFYVNGEEVTEDSGDEPLTSVGDTAVNIGSRYNGNHFFEGSIDEVRIYNRSLTASEIQSLYSTSQRGEITTRSDFRSPTRTGIRDGVFEPGNGNLSVEMVGGPEESYGERIGRSLNSSRSYLFNWSGSYRVFDSTIRFDNRNVSTSPEVGGFSVNISRYVNEFTRQFSEGVLEGVKTSGDQVEIGNSAGDDSLVGYWNFETKEPGKVTDVSGNSNDGVFRGSPDGILYNFDDSPVDLSREEDGDMSEFTGSSWSSTTSNVEKGSYSISYTGSGWSDSATDTDVTVSRGERLTFWTKPQNDMRIYFGLQQETTDALNNAEGYLILLSENDNDFGLFTNPSGPSASTSTTVNKEYYKVEVDWLHSGEIKARFYDSNGNLLESIHIKDKTYSSGGIGFETYNEGHVDKVEKSSIPVGKEGGWTNGVEDGRALDFDGDDDRVEIRNKSSLHVGANFTVASWVKVDEAETNKVFNNRDGSNMNLGLNTNINNGFRIAYNTNGDWYATTSQDDVLDTGEWAHIAATSSQETGETKIFWNGNRLKTETHAELPEKAPSEEFVIGDESGRPGTHPMNGSIDEVMLYDKALSESNITKIKNGDPPREGLVGEWTFDEGQGTIAHDTSNWKKGIRQGKALEFDGNDDYVNVGQFDFGEDYITVSAWFRSGSIDSTKRIISADDYNTEGDGERENVFIRMTDTGQLEAGMQDGSGSAPFIDSRNSYDDKKWHHAVLRLVGGESLRLYVDGNSEGSDSASFTSDVSPDIPLTIGADADENLNYGDFWDGQIGGVRIYSRALTSDEIQDLYNPSPGAFTSEFFDAGREIDWQDFSWQEELNSGDIEGRVQTASEVRETSEYSEWVEGSSSFSGPTEGLVGYWRFENPDVSGSGGTVKDWSGNGNDGTTKNGVDTYTEGFRPQSNAYSFDGEDDSVDLAKSNWGYSDVTMSFWARFDDLNSRQMLFEVGGAHFVRIKDHDSDGKYEVRGYVWDGGSNRLTGKEVSKGKWYHIALTMSSSDKANLYVDGSKQDEISIGSLDWYDDRSTAIGARYSDSEYFDGKIDEVALNSEALTAQEVQSMYTSSSYTSDWIKADQINWAQWKQTKDGSDLKPMAQWRFDEGSGQYANDSVGNNDGVLGGSTSSESSDPTWREDCRYRGCLEFDGSDDQVEVPEIVPTDNDFTISAWIKSQDGEEYNRVFTNYNGGDNWLNFGIRTNGHAVLGLDDGTDQNRAIGTSKTTDNEWHHIVGIRDGNKARIFVDGSEEGTADISAVGSTGSGQQQSISYDASNPWKGKIDDIRVYNHSLSSSSVSALYNAPSQSWASTSLQVRSRESDPESDSLVASYNFEGVGQTVIDTSGNGNSGTLGSDASESSSDPQRVSGVSGQALKFDGSEDDEVETSISSLSAPFTVSSWVKLDSISSTNQVIVSQYDASSNDWYLREGDSTEGWQIANDEGGNVEVGSQPNTGQWYQVTAVIGDQTKLFVNGENIGSATGSPSATFNPNNLQIGASGSKGDLDGAIDEVRVFDKALTQSEIENLYNVSGFTSVSANGFGESLSVNSSSIDGQSFDSKYYQFKLNSLTGASKAVPEVSSVSLANSSGWSAWSSDSDVGLDLGNSSFVQAQFNLTAGNATSTPVLDSFGFGVPREPSSLNAEPIISEADPDNENIYYKDGELSVKVSDSDDSSLSGEFLNASSNAVIDTFTIEGNGTVSTTWNDLVRDAVYEWSVSVSDGVSTTEETYNFTTYDVNLTWTDNSTTESGFRVYSNLTGSYEVVGTAPANSESFLDTSSELGPSRYVCYRVRAYNSAGESAPAEQCLDTDQLTS